VANFDIVSMDVLDIASIYANIRWCINSL